MFRSTKIVIAVGLTLIALVLGWFFIQQYAFNHPDVRIFFLATGEGEENVYTVPQIELTEKSTMGVSETWDERYFEAYALIDQMIADASSFHDMKPWHFDSKAENRDGRTVFTLYGYYTENGEKKEFSKEYSLDYILTENIEEH